MIAKNPEERRFYESRLKMQRDEEARLEATEERGEPRGEAIGRVRDAARRNATRSGEARSNVGEPEPLELLMTLAYRKK